MSAPPLLSWTPLNTNIETINKDADYIVSLDDVPLQFTSLTQFVDNGLRVRINGLRLYYLLKNKSNNDDGSGGEKRKSGGSLSSYKSLKNVCFKSVRVKSEVAQMLRSKLKLPDCMQRFLADFEVMPRGKRFRKRFIFNTYIANVVTCTKCAKLCLLEAMSLLYGYEDKCVQEFERILFKNNTLYKPPNCVNIKNKDRLCFKPGSCRGSNPICNF
ncbi:lef-2 [Agrotis segetum nucleopolyhedrovirus B]|uniref:Lef-2 n=1 Tax=Agrotis segetum nucleopolyhedrovirus B TaxID=1580580 RepID=A0A0A7KRA9_9ABAC|nr:lef-2 [Agrotis segetum nucleopolyhedrovirus B]AIZ48572.1 lef-2 [Agrotis segetum nucleopolyhedrovirus B]